MIIGITGTLGAGKGSIVEYLVTQKGHRHFSARDFLKAQIAQRGLPHNRDTMVQIANDLRATHGPGHIAERLLESARAYGGHGVIESIRTMGEARHLKTNGALIWAIDADVIIRYQRIIGRASETDFVTFEKFVSDEKREMNNADETKGNIAEVIAYADHIFHNNGSLSGLHSQIEAALRR